VSKALGHSSVVITERYYAKWNKAQQDILDGDLAGAWGKPPKPSKPRNRKSTALVPDFAKMSTVVLTQ